MDYYTILLRAWAPFATTVMVVSLGLLIAGVFFSDSRAKLHDIFVIFGTYLTLYIIGTLDAVSHTSMFYGYVSWLIAIMGFVAYLAFRLSNSRFKYLFFSPVVLTILVSIMNPLIEDRGFGFDLSGHWIA